MLSFHVLILLIKFAYLAYLIQQENNMDLTLIQSKPCIPLVD